MKNSKIIARARDHLKAVDQWRDSRDPASIGFLGSAFGYANEAKALIELLEYELSGTCGGFASGQTAQERDTLKLRLDYVEKRLAKDI